MSRFALVRGDGCASGTGGRTTLRTKSHNHPSAPGRCVRKGCSRKSNNLRIAVEQLESRELLSVTPLDPLLSMGLAETGPTTPSSTVSPIHIDWTTFSQTETGYWRAYGRVAVSGIPQVQAVGAGNIVVLDGSDLWLSTGDPVVPVSSSLLVLPKGTQIANVRIAATGNQVVLASGAELVVAPNPVPFDSDELPGALWTEVLDRSLTLENTVHFKTFSWGGYSLASVAVTPVVYDQATSTLSYYEEIEFELSLQNNIAGETLPVVDQQLASQLAGLVANPEVLQTYQILTPTSTDLYEYVVITNASLSSEFLPLVQDKVRRGITARLVTTEWIAQNYTGTETGDLADRIRDFIRDSYLRHGTRWVLLAGDSEIIPARGVHVTVGNISDSNLATDMYYACLDGPWNADGDNLWGEPTDGLGGADIDLVPEVFVGRAPVSSVVEARNFVTKTLTYTNVAHPNLESALLLGEKLDSITQGSTSNEIIRQQAIPSNWNITTLYDGATSAWTTSQVIASLNASPNIVHHLGHANSGYVARMTTSQVALLQNAFPYIMYSQGCDAGSFDTRDIAVAEQHVIAPAGAVAVIMNTRYGWYVPGASPGGSHDYALAFFKAIFNEHKTRLGEAFIESKIDNLFRLTAGGAYRWIHLSCTLFGDPELVIQTHDWQPPGNSQIAGYVYQDLNANGSFDIGEPGVAGAIVYLDLDQDGRRDQGATTFTQSTPQTLVDYGTTLSRLTVSGVGKVHTLLVSVNITHTYDADLLLTLISPSGRRVRLASNVGGSGDNFVGTVFDDSAPQLIGQGVAPFTGSFRPEEPLSLLAGEEADGVWTLEVRDTMYWDTGVLNEWSLTFVYNEPYVVTQADGSYVFSGLPAGTYTVCYEVPSQESLPPFANAGRTVSVARNQTVTGVNFASPSASSIINLGYVTDIIVQIGGQPQSLYRFSTRHEGIVSLLLASSPEAAGGQVFVYSAQGRLLSCEMTATTNGRWDWQVGANEDYFLVFSGFQGDQRFRLVNLLGISDDGLAIHGTEGADQVTVLLTDGVSVMVNGVSYDFSATELGTRRTIYIDTYDGYDNIAIQLPRGDATLTSSPGYATVSVEGWQVRANNSETIRVRAGSGTSVAHMSDSPGSDLFICRPGYAEFSGNGFLTVVENFSIVHGYSRLGGDDIAYLYDSAGDDRFVARPEQGVMSGEGYYHRAKGFRYCHGYSTAGGYDTAQLFGSAGNDTLVGRPDWTSLRGENYFLRAKFFELVQASGGNGGRDAATLTGSEGSDTFVAGPRWADMTMPSTQIRIQKFASITANAGGGWDTALLNDSAGNDYLRVWPRKAEMTGSGYQINLLNFEEITGKSSAGGTDIAELWDSPGNDEFVSQPRESYLSGVGFINRVYNFATVHGYSTAGGIDVAYLDGGQNINAWVVRPDQTTVSSEDSYRRAKAFERVFALGGLDLCDNARLLDSTGNDELVIDSDQIVFRYPTSVVTLSRIPKVTARTTGGIDRVVGRAVDVVLTLQGLWL